MNEMLEISLDSMKGPRSLIDTLAVEMLRGLDLLEIEQPGISYNYFTIIYLTVFYGVASVSTVIS